MNKIVISVSFGGYGLSNKAEMMIAAELYPQSIITMRLGTYRDVVLVDGVGVNLSLKRHDPLLVKVVETLGDEANGRSAKLVVEEIEGTQYRVEEYDGAEHIEVPEDICWETI